MHHLSLPFIGSTIYSLVLPLIPSQKSRIPSKWKIKPKLRNVRSLIIRHFDFKYFFYYKMCDLFLFGPIHAVKVSNHFGNTNQSVLTGIFFERMGSKHLKQRIQVFSENIEKKYVFRKTLNHLNE